MEQREKRPVSRVDARAQTREDVLEAAESLFLAAGYQATTVAEIAAKAGRTQGAIYSNFAGKEDLCLEVLKRRYLQEFTSLGLALALGGSLEDKLDAITTWWEKLAGRQQLTVLAAEFMLAAGRNPTQTEWLTAYNVLVQDTIAALVREHLGFDSEQLREITAHATTAVVANGSGLALAQASGMITAHESSQILTDTIRLWAGHVASQSNEQRTKRSADLRPSRW